MGPAINVDRTDDPVKKFQTETHFIRPRLRCLLVALLFSVGGMIWFVPLPAYATADAQHAVEPHGDHSEAEPHQHVQQPVILTNETPDATGNQPAVGVDENLGGFIPLDLIFRNSTGKEVSLKEIIKRPTIMALVFFHCPQACNMIQANLAAALTQATILPGKDYQVVSVSFDEEENPNHARQAKANYMTIFDESFPPDQWEFLTGSQENIDRLTKAVGFRYHKIGKHNFVHPNLIMVLGPDGQIIRYMYGLSYLPFDVSMAVSEASRGTPGISIRRLMSYCFSYDSQNKKYVFRTFRIVGIVMLISIGAFYFFFLRRGPASREKKRG
jgi:protein SCO1/2